MLILNTADKKAYIAICLNAD
uniref:Uncharacterized protein n=1 Tax=Anguilla anguilla TaxID=7936 RepID=A0A0E9RAI3_ANGAN